MSRNTVIRCVKAGGLALFAALLSSCQRVALLDPQGPIGAQNRDLLLIAFGLGLFVVIPVIVLTIWFAARYRQSNTGATYKPHWEGSIKIEAFIWLIPIAIIVVLSYLTWVKTIEVDPYRPIASTEQPLKVQVITTDWNFIFVYPDYNVATVNQLFIPVKAPVTFDMTSADVQASFFIPDLGSQMYVMAGMVSHLNLLADKPGTFTGKNMQYSGSGYDGMHFPAKALSPDEFKAWADGAKAGTSPLSQAEFDKISQQKSKLPAAVYSTVEPDLFKSLVAKFMGQRFVEGGAEAKHEK